MPARFPNSVHNALASGRDRPKSHRSQLPPTVGEISFECGLWQMLNQLAIGEADLALAGAADELNDYTLTMGKRWSLWKEPVLPGEGAMVASLARATSRVKNSPQFKQCGWDVIDDPSDAEVELAWISSAVDLKTIDVLLTGALGSAALESSYQQIAAAVRERYGSMLRHEIYKDRGGEFHSASAFGFSKALELVGNGAKGVAMYTARFPWQQGAVCNPPMTRFQIALLLALLGSLAGLLLKSVLVSVFVAALFVVGFALGITFPQMRFFGPYVCNGKPDRRAVALTFDDGPDLLDPAFIGPVERAQSSRRVFLHWRTC